MAGINIHVRTVHCTASTKPNRASRGCPLINRQESRTSISSTPLHNSASQLRQSALTMPSRASLHKSTSTLNANINNHNRGASAWRGDARVPAVRIRIEQVSIQSTIHGTQGRVISAINRALRRTNTTLVKLNSTAPRRNSQP